MGIKTAEHGSLKSHSTPREENATEPDVVVRVRWRIVQIRREQAVVGRVVPVAAPNHGAGGPTTWRGHHP